MYSRLPRSQLPVGSDAVASAIHSITLEHVSCSPFASADKWLVDSPAKIGLCVKEPARDSTSFSSILSQESSGMDAVKVFAIGRRSAAALGAHGSGGSPT